MTLVDKAAERTSLVLHLGRLLAGLHTLAENSIPPSVAEYQIAAARYSADLARWRGEATTFVVVGGVTFGHELDDILRAASKMLAAVADLARDPRTDEVQKQALLRQQIQHCQEMVVKGIDAIPIAWAPRLLEERTPFSACMSIRDAMMTARSRIHYFDRYLSADFFPLYMRDLSRATEIRLVTTTGNNAFGVQNVEPLAKLAAVEFANFQLIQCEPSDMHDRNLRIDDNIFFLGPSVSAAGKYPTNFALSDSTANGHLVLDTIISRGHRVA